MMFRTSLAVLAIFNVASTLANGDFEVHYNVRAGNGAVINDPRFSYGDGSGCGGSNHKCYCQVPSVGANRGELLMVGAGSDGTATGLDFSCIFYVSQHDSPPGNASKCSIHVDIPYIGTNHLTCTCAGYEFIGCEIPDGGHDFTKTLAILPTPTWGPPTSIVA